MNSQQSEDNDFIIKFRGTRGSYPKPNKDFLQYGGNTACVELNCGRQQIILDAGTGIIDVGNDEIKRSRLIDNKPIQTTILLSHIHQDHIQGLQFYKPLFYKTSKIHLFGMSLKGENLKDILKNILFDKVFPLAIDEISSNFEIKNCHDDNVIVISQNGDINIYNKNQNINYRDDDIKIYSYKTMFHPKNGSMCFKVEYKNKKVVYATDIESTLDIEQSFFDFISGADYLIHDAQYTELDYKKYKGYGHSSFEMAMRVKTIAKIKKLFFFHYDPDYDDKFLSEIEKQVIMNNKEVSFAKENLEILV